MLRLPVTALEYERAAARVGAELLRGPRPGDDRRDRRGARRARAGARRPHRRRPQPLGVHVVGEDGPLVEALVAAVEVARERIDLRRTRARTRGSAPPTSCRSSRCGQSDMERARAGGARRSASGSGRSGCRCSSTRRRCAARRSTGAAAPTGCSARIDAGELEPDFGPARIDPAVGGVIVGARRPLIAFNVNLRGSLEAAREIADAVRERDRRLPRRARARPGAAGRGPRPGLDERRGLGGGRAARDRRADRRRRPGGAGRR